jgi:hypothetical protein
MSGCYVYCVVPEAVAPPADLAGIDDAPVRGRAREGVCLWFSRFERRPEPSLDRVQRHHDVAAVPLADGVTPVPFRFGQWLADDHALDARIAANADAWRMRLAELAGTCELGVRARWAEAAGTARDVQRSSRGGRAYLEEIARQQARAAALRVDAERLAAALSSAVAAVAQDERVDTGTAGTLAVAYLVRVEAVDAWRAAVEPVRRANANLEFAITGPWPPYSFAG